MAQHVVAHQTSLPSEEVIVRAIQFFSTEYWTTNSQSPRSVTFLGRVNLPWIHLAGALIGLACFIVPRIILHLTFLIRARKFQNLVVTATLTVETSETLCIWKPLIPGTDSALG